MTTRRCRNFFKTELYEEGVQPFYQSFTPAYILRAYPESGGYLLRVFPEPFQLFLELGNRKDSRPVRVATFNADKGIPPYNDIIKALRKAQQEFREGRLRGI